MCIEVSINDLCVIEVVRWYLHLNPNVLLIFQFSFTSFMQNDFRIIFNRCVCVCTVVNRVHFHGYTVVPAIRCFCVIIIQQNCYYLMTRNVSYDSDDDLMADDSTHLPSSRHSPNSQCVSYEGIYHLIYIKLRISIRDAFVLNIYAIDNQWLLIHVDFVLSTTYE